MNPNYGAGVYGSVILAAIVAGQVFAIELLRMREEAVDLKGSINVVIIALLVSMLIGMAGFAIFFPIINLILQLWYTVEHKQFLKEELNNGILFVRVISVYLGVKAILNTAYGFIIDRIGTRVQLPSKLVFIGEFLRDLFTRVRRTRYVEIDSLPYHIQEIDLKAHIALQHSYYLSVLIVVWLFTIYNIRTTYTFFINIVLFFVIDDWIIISDYFSALKGRVLRGHLWRVIGINFLLLVLVGYNLFTSYPWYVGFIAIAIMAFLLYALLEDLGKILPGSHDVTGQTTELA